ncbi:MAG: ATP-binding protein [Pseudomonadota bacterium]
MRSLQGRLLVLVLAVVSAVWTGAAAVSLIGTRHELDELLDNHLAQAAALLVARQMHPDDEEEAQDPRMLDRYARRVAFQVWHEGTLALRSPNAPLTPMAAHTAGYGNTDIEGRPWRVFAARGSERDVLVYVGEQLSARREILRAASAGMLMPLLIALPMLGVLVWWAVRQGLGPLRRLSRQLAQRAPDALQPVSLPQPAAELQALAEALNALLQRIGGLLETERRFTADAAHELRTPIAAIRTQAQVALAAEEESSRRHALRATLEGCDRATHLVEQLLTLSRLETQAQPPARQGDLAAIARRAVADVAPQALDKQQQLTLQAPAHCAVAGDEALLGVLMRNLVDNAIRYSPPEARIEVRLLCEPGGCRFSVDDSGPGLGPAQQARLGERFFRVLGSGASGSGLGWSIVRRIAQAHGLGVQTSTSALGGLRVEVSGFGTVRGLPAAQDHGPAAAAR